MAKAKAKKSQAQRAAIPGNIDVGPPERYQHGDRIDLVETMLAGLRVARHRHDLLIDKIHDRDQISDRQHDAAVRLYSAWRSAGMPQTTTMPYETRIRGNGDGADKGAMSWIIYRDALMALGTRLSQLVVRVCVYEESPSHWAKDRGEQRQVGMGTLRAALDQLADHFGIV